MKSQPRANRIRIIGGEWRSRVITFPAVNGLRPTPDRIRETIFNWLGQTLYGKTCLDLFAGSGAFGFESLSRGAERVVMVESAKIVVDSLKKNSEQLQAQRLTVVNSDAVQYIQSSNERFDVIFLDPPYQARLLPTLFPILKRHLNNGGAIYFESDQSETLTAGWRILKKGHAGGVHFGLAEADDVF